MTDKISIEALRALAEGPTPEPDEYSIGAVRPAELLALVAAVEARYEINGMVERQDTDFDRLNLLFTRERMALARFDFGEAT